MIKVVIFITIVILGLSCNSGESKKPTISPTIHVTRQPLDSENSNVISIINSNSSSNRDSIAYTIEVGYDVRVKKYFQFMDSIVAAADIQLLKYKPNEYIIVHANPWIIDTLQAFDYYRMMERGIFVYDQTQLVVLRKGSQLVMPDSSWAASIQKKLKETIIDVNIPEYTLRIYQHGKKILECPVRVGRNADEFLQVVGRTVNLKTPIGRGEIVRISREPLYINPRTGKKYDKTRRDDGKYTLMPIIPWIEPSINGIRYGAMIHPTTNPETLGKAYSHGCVGTTEHDAWIIYYNAPIGTPVIFRYDLEVIQPNGDTLHLKDIYGIKQKKKK
ncbi:MAG: L,D-transpeptidase [Flavobacteriales bacterium]|nr:L,D-transpeptidase [Flavobacteriales bacterium]